MPFEIDITATGRILTYSGNLNILELQRAQELNFENKAQSKYQFIVHDFSHANLNKITKDDIPPLTLTASIASEFTTKFKVAFVTADQHAIELGKYYIECKKRAQLKWQYQIFDNVVQAIHWSES